MACACSGNQPTRLIYACSGAANAGYLADSVARKLSSLGTGSMTCLAGLGGDLSGFIESAKAADVNVVIDGCPVGCGRKIFERLGLPYAQYVLTTYGVEKGKTQITEQVVNDVTLKLAGELSNVKCC